MIRINKEDLDLEGIIMKENKKMTVRESFPVTTSLKFKKRHLLDSDEVARRIHITRRTLARYVAENKLKPLPRTRPKDGCLFKREEVDEFAKLLPFKTGRKPKPKEELRTQSL